MIKADLKKDIEESIKLLRNGRAYFNDNNEQIGFMRYDSIYPYNNEGIKYYYTDQNYDGNILTVASSGDHMLHSILMGATDITLFDINRLTKYYCNLKLAGVRTLGYNDFFSFFGNKSNEAPALNNIDLYEKVREAMSQDDRLYWDSLYDNGICDINVRRRLFNLVSDPSANAYYDLEKYVELSGMAIENFTEPKFIESDILCLPDFLEPEKTYSSIFLSNISDYLKGDKLDKYAKVLSKELYARLDDGGIIVGAIPKAHEILYGRCSTNPIIRK